MRRDVDDELDDMALDPISRDVVERTVRKAYDAMFGTGTFDALDLLKRDDAIKAARDYLDSTGAGFAPW